jgi:adenylosuccinate synthase
MKVDVLLGLQWGDEGKGKIVDVLASKYDIIARFQGGPNAGHTLEINGSKHILHTIPSGIFREEVVNVIGNGVVIDPVVLMSEIETLFKINVDVKKNLYISKKAHLIFPTHRVIDAALELSKGCQKIGSTLKGIGPVYTDKIARCGVRIGDIAMQNFKSRYNAFKEIHLNVIRNYGFDIGSHKIDGYSFNDYEQKWLESVEKLKGFKFIDSEYYINKAISENKSVLAEGAQGTMLDIDFGTYPFVTSSNTVSSAVCTGLGIGPHKIGKVFGIVKAYCTRVGSGPFPTELSDSNGEKLREIGKEFGSTTGRPRRCGWMDLIALKYSIMLNSVSEIFLTKADVMSGFEKVSICTAYENHNQTIDFIPYEICESRVKPLYKEFNGWGNLKNVKTFAGLPQELLNYISFIEKETNVPVTIVSTGPDREQILINR